MNSFKINGKVVEIELDDGRVVKAMTSYLENMTKTLDIDMDEAVLTWLEDEGYLINDEQEELCAAAKENKVLIGARSGKEKKKTVRTVKENPTKEAIINALADAVKNIEGADNIIIENKGKIITFTMNGENFKIDLVQKRKGNK